MVSSIALGVRGEGALNNLDMLEGLHVLPSVGRGGRSIAFRGPTGALAEKTTNGFVEAS